jgi:cell division protein ZapB
MEAEIHALEEKINQAVQLCQRIRAENLQLRQRLATSENDNKQLTEKINDARGRLESLLSKIPENAE